MTVLGRQRSIGWSSGRADRSRWAASPIEVPGHRAVSPHRGRYVHLHAVRQAGPHRSAGWPTPFGRLTCAGQTRRWWLLAPRALAGHPVRRVRVSRLTAGWNAAFLVDAHRRVAVRAAGAPAHRPTGLGTAIVVAELAGLSWLSRLAWMSALAWLPGLAWLSVAALGSSHRLA